MKASHFLLSILFISLLNTSCRKDGGRKYTIKGQIFQSCTSTPIANQEISFFQGISSNGLSTSGGDLGTTITDANGNFSFTYTAKNGSDIKIQKAAGAGFATIIHGVPGDQNLENIKIYFRPSTTVQVKLNVSKSYSSFDTLYITNFRNTSLLAIPGPFTSKVLYNAEDYPIMNYYYRPSNYLISLVYKVGNNNTFMKKSFELTPCDTSKVTVDIN